MRAVGFRRQEGAFDFARRFRFAYSLEHYNNFTGKRWIPKESEFSDRHTGVAFGSLAGRIIARSEVRGQRVQRSNVAVSNRGSGRITSWLTADCSPLMLPSDR